MRISFTTSRQPCAGFTLIEMMVALVAGSIMMGVIFLTLAANWSAFDDYISRANIWQEAEAIVTAVSNEGRQAGSISVSTDQQRATFYDQTGNEIVEYRMENDGRFTATRPGQNTVTLTENIDLANSYLEARGQSVFVRLAFSEDMFFRQIHVVTGVEVFPRN